MTTELSDRCWSGESCLLVGGGPSATAYGVRLWAESRVIAVNAVAALVAEVRLPDVIFAADRRVYDLLRADRRFDAVPHKVHQLPDGVGGDLDPGWTRMKATERSEWSRSLADGLVYGSNAGLAALNLACVLGADPIYLLGFDLRPGRDGQTINGHDEYPESWRQAGTVYETFLADFRRHAESAKAGHRQIVNLNPFSALDCFEGTR